MNWIAVIVSVCFVNTMLAISVLAHIMDLMEDPVYYGDC